jgi:adenylate cyclase
MPAKLILLGATPTDYELGAKSTLGRHPENTIQVLDRIVSKEHAIVTCEPGNRFRLKDTGSLNGTFINGQRVDEHWLRNGDQISMGSTTFRFCQTSDEVTVDAHVSQTVPAAKASASANASATASTGKSAAPVVSKKPRQVTIFANQMQSEIQTSLAATRNFLPAAQISDQDALRADYEKLRIAHELSKCFAVTTDLDKVLQQIVDETFKLIAAERAVILLYDPLTDTLTPHFVRQQRDEEIKLSTSILDEVKRNRCAVLSSDASTDERFRRAKSIIMQGIRSTMCVPIQFNDELLGIFHMDSTLARGAFTEKDLQLFTGIAAQAAAAIQNVRLAKKIELEAHTRAQFQRLVSPSLVDKIVSGELRLEQGGELREVTMLFADIRGFTSMSERTAPEEMVRTLNAYFERMVDSLFEYGGTLDKYVGDEIIGLFGAPVSLPDAPLRAVRCALDMLERLSAFNVERASRGESAIEIGIGLNTGHVVAGAIGSPQTLQYTVIGDAVNTAARLCSVARAGEVIISSMTYEKCGSSFDIEKRAPVKVKGKADPLPIYRVLSLRRAAARRSVA